MKTTKRTLLSIAIIAALPFTVNAAQTIVETNTPAAVGANGTVKKATDSGPYQTATIGEHDDEHIATTAYVKGAYNDAIAAVNKVNSDKQDDLGLSGVMDASELWARTEDYVFMPESRDGAIANTSDKAVTAAGVMQTLHMYDSDLKVGVLDKQRVRIYTTWGTDTVAATTLVPFEMAQ